MNGTELTGRYRLEERIAAGGMGTVYQATDGRLNRKVAVKLLNTELAQDARFVERFRREARAAAALTHPNVAGVYDYGEDDDRYFIVMELVPGRDLARMLRKDGPIEPERAAALGAQICLALGHAHATGLIHRDIKPANVIVTPEDRVKVTDFGIVRAAGDSTITGTGTVLGTAQYLSPEQASGREVSPATDLYSSGIVLYEMVTGAAPFAGESPIAVAMKQISDPVPRPSAINPDVPETLDRVVEKATAKDPGERYGDASEMAAALQDVAAGQSTGTKVMAAGGAAGTTAVLPDAGPQTVWPIPGDRWNPARLGRIVLFAFLVLAVLAAGLLGIRVLSGQGDPEESAPGAAEQTQPVEEAEEEEPEPEPQEYEIQQGIIGMKYKDAEKELEDAGLIVIREDVASEADKDTVVAVEPDVGSVVREGDDITLFVSTGDDDDDDDDDDDRPGRGRGRGRDGEGNDD